MLDIDWLIGTAEARINHFLRNNELDIPKDINNSVFKITLPQAPILKQQSVLYCHLYAQRVILSKQQTETDVAIDITSDALIGMAKGEKLSVLLLEKKMYMHGDIGKAHALQHWLESLALTKDDVFADVFGETLGPLLSSLEKQAEPILSNIFELGKNFLQQFTETSRSNSTDDNQALKQQVTRLREQADRLEAKVKALNDELQAQKGS